MTNSDETSKPVKKILVALDYSHQSRAALDLAVSIAKLMEASIHGLFVHDDQWVRIGKLSSVMTVDDLTGRISSSGQNSINQEIRSLEKTIQQHFELITRSHGLSHTWTTDKGAVAEKILDASQQTDIITIGSKGRSYYKSGKIGKTALAILQTAKKPVLILSDSHSLRRSPVVVYDGSARSLSGLTIATEIAKENDDALTILDISEAFPTSKNDGAQLKDVLDSDLDTEILSLDQPDMARFLHLLSKYRGRLLILPKNKRFTNRTVLVHVLDSAESPVLLSI